MRHMDGYLKGVNLGGWLSQCGKNYTEEHYNTFITEKDIDEALEFYSSRERRFGKIDKNDK